MHGMKKAHEHAQDSKTQMNQQIHNQANAAYGEYMDLHTMQKGDLDRSMSRLAQSMEDEEKRLADCSDEIFHPDFVETDKQRGVEHLAKIQQIVDKQEAVYRGIMAKMAGDAPAKVRKERTDPTDEPLDASNVYRKREHASVRVANSCLVANALVKKQARYENFHHNRLLVAMAEEEKTSALKARHAELDRLADRSMQNLHEKQMIKSLASQQKRNEQQKMLKEIQRFQDQQFELLQLKHHPEAVSTNKHLPPVAHAKAPQTAPGSSMGSSKSEPRLARTLTSDPIYKEMQQSHKLFASTLDRWRSFEADNEKRTEAYWRKMLQGERKKEADRKESKFTVLRHKVANMNAVRKFVANAHTSIEDDDLDHVDTVEGIDQDAPLLPLETTMNPLAQTSVYSERLEKVRQHQLEKERLAFQKRQRDMKYLEDKIKKSKQLQQERSAKASENMRQWEEKNMATTMKREKASNQNDGDFYRKLESQKQTFDEKKAREEEERNEYFGARAQAGETAYNAAKANKEQFKQTHKEKQAEKHGTSAARLEEKLKSIERVADASPTEIMREKIEMKQKSEQKLSATVKKEIENKLARVDEAKKRMAKPQNARETIEKQRLIRKDKEKRRRPSFSELALPPDLAPASHLFLSSPSHAQRSMTTEVVDSFESPPLDEALPQSADSEPGMRVTGTRSSGFLSVVSAGSSSAGQSPALRHGLSTAGGSSLHSTLTSTRTHDSHSESESDDGGNHFLDDLQARSSNWLKDLRRKSDVLG